MFTITLMEVLGVVLSAVASIVVGALWYSPLLFGTIWMREVGLTEAKMKSMSTTPTQAISIAIVLGIAFSILTNVLFTWIGVRTVAQGAVLGVLCCVTFFCLPLLVHTVFEDTSKKAWAIYALHELLLSAIIGALISWSITA